MSASAVVKYDDDKGLRNRQVCSTLISQYLVNMDKVKKALQQSNLDVIVKATEFMKYQPEDILRILSLSDNIGLITLVDRRVCGFYYTQTSISDPTEYSRNNHLFSISVRSRLSFSTVGTDICSPIKALSTIITEYNLGSVIDLQPVVDYLSYLNESDYCLVSKYFDTFNGANKVVMVFQSEDSNQAVKVTIDLTVCDLIRRSMNDL